MSQLVHTDVDLPKGSDRHIDRKDFWSMEWLFDKPISIDSNDEDLTKAAIHIIPIFY